MTTREKWSVSYWWRWLNRQEQPYVPVQAFTYGTDKDGKPMDKPSARYAPVSSEKARDAAQRALAASVSDRQIEQPRKPKKLRSISGGRA